MSLQNNLNGGFTRVATEFKKVYGKIGDLASLSTTDKTSLVAALNELKTAVSGVISDSSSDTSHTLSANKILQMIASAKSEIIGGADSAHDTLVEIQNLLNTEDGALSALNTALGNRVRFDAAQTLSASQKAQALANIGGVGTADIGDVNADFVAVFNAALV